MARRPIQVANCSGFYGDRLAAAREMPSAATTRPDARAKGLGEYLRSRTVLVPGELT